MLSYSSHFGLEKLEPDEPPIVGRCICCGAEIYNPDWIDLYDWMCEDCFYETRETDD